MIVYEQSLIANTLTIHPHHFMYISDHSRENFGQENFGESLVIHLRNSPKFSASKIL